MTGIDITESMLSIARKNNPNGMAKLEIGDATHMRFEDAGYDISTISFALHDMPPMIRENVLREMVRVTRIDGTFMIIDYALPRNKMGRDLIYRFITLYEGEYYKEFITFDIQGLLKKVGIQVVDEFSALFGAVRVVKGIRIGSST